MKKCQKKKQFEEIARGSRLIKLIYKLSNIKETHETRGYQEKIDKLKLRYSVDSLAGRLEFISDLIMAKKEDLNDCEKRALNYFLEDLAKKRDGALTFLSFYIDYLSLTIKEYAENSFKISPPPYPIHNNIIDNRSTAGSLLLALTLTGLLASGCTQKKENVQSFNSYKKETGISATLELKENTMEQQINQNQTKEFADNIYSVREGDSLTTLASKLGFDYREIVKRNSIKYNHDKNWFVIHPGQILTLPYKPDHDKSENIKIKVDTSQPDSDFLALNKNNSEGGYVYHLIEKGESLWKISKNYKTTVQKIVEMNKISPLDKIRYGNMLKIPSETETVDNNTPFNLLSHKGKVEFLKERTIKAGHPYLETIVEMAEGYKIDPRLYTALIWEESWFDIDARSKDNCRRLAQLDPRFHKISDNFKENFRKSLGYLRYEFVYYRKKGFDSKSAAICALAAYNGGTTRVRNYVAEGAWDGRDIETFPLKETRDHIKKVIHRCKNNYQATL